MHALGRSRKVAAVLLACLLCADAARAGLLFMRGEGISINGSDGITLTNLSGISVTGSDDLLVFRPNGISVTGSDGISVTG